MSVVGDRKRRFWTATAITAVITAITWAAVRYLPEPQPPAPPQGIAVTAAPDSVNVQWLQSPDDAKVREYQLFRDEKRVAAGRDLAFVDRVVAAGNSYTYRVVALGSNGLVSAGEEKVAQVPRVLGAPTAVQALYVSENQVQITWSISVGDAPEGFTVLRDGVEIGEADTNVFVDMSVAADKGYKYTVRAFGKSKAWKSADSQALTVQTLRPGAPPIQNTTIIRPQVPGPSAPLPATGPTQAVPANLAWISLADGSAVSYCLPLSGPADLADGKAILTAHRRVNNPPETTYYFDRGSVAQGGKSWTGREYLGGQTGQIYEIYVLVMDRAAADLFWNQHANGDKTFAFADSLPVSPSDKKKVTQTSLADC